jgi:putative SOS response-associated peptidase YedK
MPLWFRGNLARMCGRFAAGHLTQAQMQDIVEGFLEGSVLLDTQAPKPVRSYHVRPTNRIGLVVRGDEGFWLTSANWQIAPKGGRPLINARIENDGFWRQAWAHGRCMIPALGYFEWTQQSGRKEPVFVTVKSNAPVLFFCGVPIRGSAGLCDPHPPAEQTDRTYPFADARHFGASRDERLA